MGRGCFFVWFVTFSSKMGFVADGVESESSLCIRALISLDNEFHSHYSETRDSHLIGTESLKI